MNNFTQVSEQFFEKYSLRTVNKPITINLKLLKIIHFYRNEITVQIKILIKVKN